MNQIIFSIICLSMIFNLIHGQSSIFTCTQTKNPNAEADCTSKTTNEGNFCCFILPIQGESIENYCLSIPKISYDGASTYIYNNIPYTIKCGKGAPTPSTNILKKCGPSDALSKEDCSTGSSFVESCCYYTGSGATNVPKPTAGCYWLGTKYAGETTWAGMPLECSAHYLAFSMSLLFLFLCFLF